MSTDPSRNNNHASSAYAGRPTAQDDLTWLDFLRTAGGTVRDDPRPPQLDRTDSAERKRRHTGSEPQQRTHPHPYQTYNRSSANPSSQLGNSVETAIDLTSPQRPPPPPRPTHSHPTHPHAARPARPAVRPSITSMQGSTASGGAARRESDIVLPKWQPDHEATECPVCHTEFSIFYRRHHCRKCGRVVCATCSPHRITIPRQYIVQPPNPFYEDEGNPSSPGGLNPALGGGEVVRVCNPCVPDPWTPVVSAALSAPLPPAPTNTATGVANNNTFPGRWDGTIRGPGQHRPERYLDGRMERRDRASSFQNAPWNRPDTTSELPGVSSSYGGPRFGPGFPDTPSNRRLLSEEQQRFTIAQNRPDNWSTSQHAPWYRRDPDTGRSEMGDFHDQIDPRVRHRYSQSRVSGSSVPMPPNRPPPSLPNRPPPPPPPPGQAAPPTRAPPAVPQDRPRREVKEEDECPVCGTEMPPGEAVREAHIQDCIASRFSSTPSQQARSAPPAADAIASAPPARETASNTPEGSRPRATSYRPRGMALYRATEKDCTTEDGEPQECVICFEEFEEGDEMGRMECLCKFHRACIRQWWETKGQGSCPTHQLHD